MSAHENRCSAQRLTQELGGDWHGRYGLVPDLGHSPKDRGLKVWDGADGRVLVHSFHGRAWREVRDELKNLGFDLGDTIPRGNAAAASIERRKAKNENDRLRRLDHARSIWAGSVPITEETLTQKYLIGRGIEPPYSDNLRHHETAPIMEPGARKHCPAMVALITNSKTAVNCGVHITYLDPRGVKARGLRAAKKIRGCPSGGAVWPPGQPRQILLAEGIETALSAERLLGVPAVAALSCGNLRNVEMPPWVQHVIIVADNDTNGVGTSAAMRAAQALLALGLRCELKTPRHHGDANDLLVHSMKGTSHG